MEPINVIREGQYKVQLIAVHENQYNFIMTLFVNEYVEIHVNIDEKIATVFFNDIEMIVHFNKATAGIFNRMYDANFEYILLLLQILRVYEIEEMAAI
ncbi:hypothetical protein [Lysinibacillus sp. 54212]|uniref:hypothetical protein n=1 Tax=Lysinibacillus sp. 54212 TaxID=3119829 RepID=UPI002FC74FFA